MIRARRRLLPAIVLAVAAILLTGAAAFGAWHVVVGGAITGNPRAVEFGALLSTVSTVLLVVVAIVARRIGS